MGRRRRVVGVNLNNRTFWGWCGHAFDPRETRGRPAKNTREGAGGGNLNNRTVLGRHRGVRGEGIKSQKCTSVPAYQQFSKIYTCARARVFYGNCWYAGTLVHPKHYSPKEKSITMHHAASYGFFFCIRNSHYLFPFALLWVWQSI